MEARRAAQRQTDPRVRTALEKAAQDRAWLDSEAAKVQAVVAEWKAELAARKVPAPPLHDLTNRCAGERGWGLGQATMLLEDGYSLRHVCQLTGWGGWWFKNGVGNDGYARRENGWTA